ncbi:MAG: hypothetical protein L3J93_03755, partial [Thermoplasmata archaeon]|nr:hypothetical protein [Thermoplasmata archaeon]
MPERMPARPKAPTGPVLGVDIGATKVSAAVVGLDGRVTNHGGRAAHPNEGAASVLEQAAGVIRTALEGETPLAIGVGVA